MMNTILHGVGAIAVVSGAMAWGCSSSTNDTVVACDAGDGDSGLPGEPVEAAAPPIDAESDAAPLTDGKNPYGVAYPTKSLGYRVRAMGTKGNVIPNLKFTGYARGDAAPSIVELADVLDPEGRTHDVVAVHLVSAWDLYSKEIVKDVKAAPPTRAALLLAFGEGETPGAAATSKNLGDWWTQTNLPAWYALDSSFAQLSTFFDGNLPVLVVLDARTMEIVSYTPGYFADWKTKLEAAAAEVKARPPSY
jgi:hypothetical protein